jgi:tagatose 6-phosphate kinase
MILTVTLNPCVDKSLFVERNVPVESLRPERVVCLAGGKGVNVARALTRLDEPAQAFMPLGGHVGADTDGLARREGLDPVVVPISGRTRTALTVREESTGCYWHYLEPGPEWTPADRETIQHAYRAALQSCDMVVISGSLPCRSAEPLVPWMIETAREQGRRTVLDTHGPGLRLGLAARPWLVKPNREELASMLDRPLDADEAAWQAVRKLAGSGVTVVLLSAGAGPLFASWDGDEWEVLPPPVAAVNPLGSGDSLVAGVLAAVRRGFSPPDALRWGAACGAANAAVWDPGGICRTDVERLLAHVIVRRVATASSPQEAAGFGPV